MVGALLWVGCWRLWGGVSKAESRGSEADVEEIAAAGEREGAGLRSAPGALLHQVGHRVRGERLVDQGLLHGPRPRCRGVDGAPGHHCAHVMMRSEAPRLPLEGRRLRARREREEAPADLVSAGFLAVFHERLGMLGVCASCMPLVTAAMAGHALGTPRETQTLGSGLQRQGVAGLRRGAGIAVGRNGQTPLAGGAALGHRGASEGRPRPGP